MLTPFWCFILFLLLTTSNSNEYTAEDLLSFGDNALGEGSTISAIDFYQDGIKALLPDESILISLSLNTNLGSALSSINRNDEAIQAYQTAIKLHKDEIEEIVDRETAQLANEITSQTSFYLGMVFQDEEKSREAIESYGYAVMLDPLHWAALANLGSVLQDSLKNHDEALLAYNKAYGLLVQTDKEPTDPPEEPKPILSQLQHRIGLCLSNDPDRKCVVEDDPGKEVSCREMATHAFSLAAEFDPRNEAAKHMLATMTADATMVRASNQYVKSLFDNYAHNFEHSLVKELGYNGYERLRLGFDRAFDGRPIPVFPVVVDAGCGTGLVGEQFRNVSKHLIGVDLSEAILDEAEKLRPALYDERIADDVMTVFREKKPISLIVAADSYIYFGDLVPLFEAMADGLSSKDGYLAFTLENVGVEAEETLTESKPDWRWQLTASGRFAHRKEYVVSVAGEHGISLIHYEAIDGFRHEQGKDVRGHLFVMKIGSASARDDL